MNIFIFDVDARFGGQKEFFAAKETGQFLVLDFAQILGAALHFCNFLANEIPSLHRQQKMAGPGKHWKEMNADVHNSYLALKRHDETENDDILFSL